MTINSENFPMWIIYNLRKYNNCLLDKKILKKISEAGITEILEEYGFEGISIEIVNEDRIIEVKKIDRLF